MGTGSSSAACQGWGSDLRVAPEATGRQLALLRPNSSKTVLSRTYRTPSWTLADPRRELPTAHRGLGSASRLLYDTPVPGPSQSLIPVAGPHVGPEVRSPGAGGQALTAVSQRELPVRLSPSQCHTRACAQAPRGFQIHSQTQAPWVHTAALECPCPHSSLGGLAGWLDPQAGMELLSRTPHLADLREQRQAQLRSWGGKVQRHYRTPGLCHNMTERTGRLYRAANTQHQDRKTKACCLEGQTAVRTWPFHSWPPG
ncbi:uncharacterized protein LOC102495772 [Tupaia chinensis]|uniref:uncharacterized protein LOC102495772 n=1 Tax=Tupaia chinensis TaxID=246437 RepID=UPI000FFC3A91|nr:uncharacterized protein LOC102495772 [Tupaia chinensis]